MNKKEELKARILVLTRAYYAEIHGRQKDFLPGKTFVNYGGRYFDERELMNLGGFSLDFRLTASPWAHKFETRFAQWLGMKFCALTTSGSSVGSFYHKYIFPLFIILFSSVR